MKINNRVISNKNKPYIIAEIGVNHNGSMNKALKMIDISIKAGCDAVKFQTFQVDQLLIKKTKLAKYQKKTKFKNMYDLLNNIKLSKNDFVNLKKYCDKKKITFLSTPFDLESAIFLNKI